MKIIDGANVRILYSSVVGSHAWKMNHIGSDWDFWDIYQARSIDFFLGKRHLGGHESHGKFNDGIPWDRSSFEIGSHVDQIRGGNINHVVCLLAPSIDATYPRRIVDYDRISKKNLQNVLKSNPSKNVFKSINGMTNSNLRKYFDPGTQSYLPDVPKMSKKRAKKLAQILRLVMFGFRVLTEGKYVLSPCKIGDGSVQDEILVRQWQQDMTKAYDASDLPEKPDEKPFNDFILDLRMNDLREYYGHL